MRVLYMELLIDWWNVMDGFKNVICVLNWMGRFVNGCILVIG